MSQLSRFSRILLLFSVAVVLCASGAQAQSHDATGALQPSHKVYVEGLGSAGFYSLNYERTLIRGLNARLGAAFVPRVSSEYTEQVLVPVTVSYLIGREGHHVEAGAGVTSQLYGREREPDFGPSSSDEREFAGMEYVPTLLAGYRYQSPNGGWIFRATYTPFIAKFEGWISSVGVSVGYGF